ncbi:lipopolysaccharide core heptose(I) kinase RfaP [Pseudomonas aeruginosa]|nr:lipopolysaccharide core heptose(I) kinase RfaP [Pseudomonas aeruginosa]
MRLVLEEPFKRLWSGRDPFEAVEALQGKVYRELEGRRTLRTEVDGAATSSRSTVASAGARSPRTCSPPSSRCSARARSGRPSGACTRPA